MYTVAYSKPVEKELRKLSRNKVLFRSLIKQIQGLAKNPQPIGAEKLKGTTNVYRLRQGQYRIVYSIEKNKLVVLIIRVGHRKDVYRQLSSTN